MGWAVFAEAQQLQRRPEKPSRASHDKFASGLRAPAGPGGNKTVA